MDLAQPIIPRASGRSVWLFLTLIAVLHAWQACSVSDTFSTTADEIAHLTAGVSYWQDDDYRLQPENGLLPQRWAALPLVNHNLRQLDRQHPAWKEANVWLIGEHFFHRQGNDLAAMLRSGRTMIALLGGLLVLVLGKWAWELAGPTGGLVTALLAGFSPTFLAHNGLITSDGVAALGFIAASAAWWRLFHRVSAGRVLLAGLALGGLALAKFSAVLFAPMAGLMLCVRLTRATPLAVAFGRTGQKSRRGGFRLFALTAATLIASTIAWTFIWAGYGFRYEAKGPDAGPNAHFALPWDTVLLEPAQETAFIMADGTPHDPVKILQPGAVQAFVKLARQHQLLPEAWLYGLAFVDRASRFRLAYFAGDWNATGWKSFFPVAYLLKSTWPELLLHAGGLAVLLVGAIRSRRGRTLLYKSSPLLIVLGIYGLFSIQSSLNIGHRHILPMYACLAIIAGLIARHSSTRAVKATLAISLLAQITLALLSRPDYLSYFNRLAGPPAENHRYLVDSSLDWGQDLPRLRHWIDTQAQGTPLFLSYFGSGSPRFYGINATRIGDTYFDLDRNRPAAPPWTGGWYIISATMWQRVYTHVRGPWSAGYEARYQELRGWVRELNKTPPPAAEDQGQIISAKTDLGDKLVNFDHLRFGRLCHFLRHRQPDAHIGASFLAFKLTDAEIVAILSGPLPDQNNFPEP